MGTKSFVYDSWVGGQAIDKKTGTANSFANSQSLDFRKSPSQLTILPRTRRTDGGVVTDLVQNEVMTESGRTYSIGSSGNVYTTSPAGVWSLFGTIGQVGTFGIDYRQDQNAIYIAGTTSVSSITNVSGTPTLNPGYYGESQSTYDNSSQAGFNVNSNQSGGTLTTSILTSYVENDPTEERFYQTDIQPISKIGVNVTAIGTGDWTLVVHDGLNNQLGTATILVANRVVGINYFVFSTPIQVNVGPNSAQTYHFHLTSTNTGGTISSTISNNLSSADMELWANRLVATNNGIHPIETFQQFTCIGNGRYLSVWENLGEAQPTNAEWQRQKLSFPPGYEVCGLTVFNEYLVIATQRTTTGTNTPQAGIIFYWDGLSDTYNYFTPIPEGSPQNITVFKNALHYIASGTRYIIATVAADPEDYRNMPGAENTYTLDNSETQVYPYSSDVRNNVLLFAWPCTTTNTTIPYGVYSWGRVESSQPYSFGYSYILSTGSQYKTGSNNLTIGMVRNFGSVMHISWRDDSSGAVTYGVDIVDANSPPAAYSTWEGLIEDNSIVIKQKQGIAVAGKWLDMQDGVEIVLKYAINRGNWVYSERFSNSNLWPVDNETGFARFDIGTSDVEERFYEIQPGIDIYCDDTVTDTPIIVGAGLVEDTLDGEDLGSV